MARWARVSTHALPAPELPPVMRLQRGQDFHLLRLARVGHRHHVARAAVGAIEAAGLIVQR